jgi:ribonuclease HI
MCVMTPTPAPQEAATQPAVWHAWFDGSAAPNPGKIGIGALLVAPNGIRTEKSLPLNRCGCNNEAELHALSLVLDMAEAAGARTLAIRGDSKAVADWIVGTDSTEIEPLATLVTSIRARISAFGNVSICWTPRHKNKEADRLSRRALGLSEAEPARKNGRRRRR